MSMETGLTAVEGPWAADSGAWAAVAVRLGLSVRELEIIQALMEEDDDAAIAKRLHMAPGTLRTHLGRLFRKLGVKNRSRALAVGFRTYVEIIEEQRRSAA